MSVPGSSDSPLPHLTESEWYDLSIDWAARLAREIPVLVDVFGSPAEGGIIDAGCGTGHQAAALAARGYRVIGADLSEEMLSVARRNQANSPDNPRWVCAPYGKLQDTVGRGFDGVYCLANSLAAAGSCRAVEEAVCQFAACLRQRGRMFVQVLNFAPMQRESPCVKGPRVTHVNGVEYLSVRHFQFDAQGTFVSNITCWREGGWKVHSQGRRLYPVSLAELRRFCGEAGFSIDAEWGSYAGEPFDVDRSVDLILVASKSAAA